MSTRDIENQFYLFGKSISGKILEKLEPDDLWLYYQDAQHTTQAALDIVL